jgi:hypothetical protein
MRIKPLVLFSLLIFGCAEKREGEIKNTLFSRFVEITDNEDKGIKEVLALYGGYCEYSFGQSFSTDDGRSKYFELKVSESQLIEDYKANPQFIASNVAYLFYKNLEDEIENYKAIHVIIKFEDESSVEFEIQSKELEIVHSKMPLVLNSVELIKQKEFNTLASKISPEVYSINQESFANRLTEVDPQFGEVQDFVTFGYQFYRTETDVELLRISGIILRDIQNSQFSVDVSSQISDEKLYLVQYKL